MTRAQIFVQTLYRVYTSFKNDILNLIITKYVSDFYIGDQNRTNSTIFMYNNTVSAELSQALWTDQEYGWSHPLTLSKWVDIVEGYMEDDTYDPRTNPNYDPILHHFNMSDETMMNLVGAGNKETASQLFLIVFAVENTLATEKDCVNLVYCEGNELFAMQFFDANLTRYPLYNKIKPQNSIADLNSTYYMPPEIDAVKNGRNVGFKRGLADFLFALSEDRKAPLPESQTTLFNINNVQVILNNQNNTQAIVDNFYLESP